jgi:hypothetical protein
MRGKRQHIEGRGGISVRKGSMDFKLKWRSPCLGTMFLMSQPLLRNGQWCVVGKLLLLSGDVTLLPLLVKETLYS